MADGPDQADFPERKIRAVNRGTATRWEGRRRARHTVHREKDGARVSKDLLPIGGGLTCTAVVADTRPGTQGPDKLPIDKGDAMIKVMRQMGISSSMLYTAGIASIGMSVAAWYTSRNIESRGLARADRWGIFVGTWAPTFFALGNAMRLEEEMGTEEPHGKMQQVKERVKEKMPVS